MESELSDKSKEIALLRAEGEKACQAIEAVQDENVSLKEKCHTFEKYIESYANELAKKNDELHQANENISKLQENFSKVIEEQKREIEDKGRIDLNLTEMRKILVDKEEEITRFKNLVSWHLFLFSSTNLKLFILIECRVYRKERKPGEASRAGSHSNRVGAVESGWRPQRTQPSEHPSDRLRAGQEKDRRVGQHCE